MFLIFLPSWASNVSKMFLKLTNPITWIYTCIHYIFENITIEIIAVFVVSLVRISLVRIFVVRMLQCLFLTFSSFKLLLFFVFYFKNLRSVLLRYVLLREWLYSLHFPEPCLRLWAWPCFLIVS